MIFSKDNYPIIAGLQFVKGQLIGDEVDLNGLKIRLLFSGLALIGDQGIRFKVDPHWFKLSYFTGSLIGYW